MLAVICSLFVFLGMYIGNKYDLKKYSINSIFGLFVINGLGRILLNSYLFLYMNYHKGTFLFLEATWLLLSLIVTFRLLVFRYPVPFLA